MKKIFTLLTLSLAFAFASAQTCGTQSPTASNGYYSGNQGNYGTSTGYGTYAGTPYGYYANNAYYNDNGYGTYQGDPQAYGNGFGAGQYPYGQMPSPAGFCDFPMEPAAFRAALRSIDAQGFDETKLRVAKQIASSNCLSSAQVAEVVGLFGFEGSRLNFAKFAYEYSFDPPNYFMVNDMLHFSSSVDELTGFIAGVPLPQSAPAYPGYTEPYYEPEPDGPYYPAAYVGSGGCAGPMEEMRFRAAQRTIEGQGFDSSKLRVAQQVAAGNCLASEQVLELVSMMSFEGSKLELAKFCYDYVLDPQNYFIVNQAFGFSSSVNELAGYLASR